MKLKFNIYYILLFILIASSNTITFSADNPHKVLNFDCKVCHTTTSFSEVEFDHSKNTNFDLEGKHANQLCQSCHSLDNFAKVQTNCQSCHIDIHEAKLSPDCMKCHTPEKWNSFDIFSIHFETNFPIMGKHAMLDCDQCHAGFPIGDLSHTDDRCIACHQMDYLSTTEPSHVDAGFSTNCELCHQPNVFKPAFLPDHDGFFPIFSGRHNNEWNSCIDCHQTSGTFSEFNCLSCHEHEKTETDGKHVGMTGYLYDSPSCYACHPTGEAGDFAEHDAQFFPIFSGRHNRNWDDCVTCHTDPIATSSFNCFSCHDHEQSVTDPIHAGMPGYNYDSPTCLSCHPTGEAGQFTEHDAQFFPIYSGTHIQNWANCASCHTIPTDKAQFSCIDCHDHNQGVTDPIHVGMLGYIYDSPSCFGCHPTGEAGEFVDHDAQFFPIFSGAHNTKWDNCTTCHTNPSDRKVFTCFNCHDHSETLMDEKHVGKVTNYIYDSDECYSCHPNGKNES